MLALCYENIVRKAYKKLKANVYHDKTMPLLRHALMKFEKRYGDILDEYLDDIGRWLENRDEFQDKIRCILEEIDCIPLPKTFEKNTNIKNESIIVNYEVDDYKVDKIQYYIDMPVVGHILGVLWIMLIGRHLDEKMYKHIYGNRISKYIANNHKEYNESTYLFEPYFIQYESWRDKGLDCAEKVIANKDNVVIITLDLERYYYSVDINRDVMDRILDEVLIDTLSDNEKSIYLLLNSFVSSVIDCYSNKLAELDDEFGHRRVLPIGFLPSNIISNWFLKDFDRAIVDGWNPVYYGRYVDDILIVDSVTDDSCLGGKAKKGILQKEEVINFYLAKCTKWKELNCEKSKNHKKNNALALRIDDDEIKYAVNPVYYPCAPNESLLIFNLSKTKLFYFDWQQSKSLITCFKKQIAKNKSEFRHMPDEDIFKKDDYTDIYKLINETSLNKLRGITNFEVDKFELSKFIGKYLKICSMIRTKRELKFEKDILEIFNGRVALENYTLWEKVIEIFIIKENYNGLERFCNSINESIESIKYYKSSNIEKIIKKMLREILYVNLCRCFALVWKESRKSVQLSLTESTFRSKDEDYGDMDENIVGYCRARMIDKSVMPILYDMLDLTDLSCDCDINFTSFDECINRLKKLWDSSYKYYPYLINVTDFCFVSNLESSMRHERDNDIISDDVFDRYFSVNFNKEYARNRDKTVCEYLEKNNTRYLAVGSGEKDRLMIAIANVVLKHEDFEKVVIDNRNRSYERYKNLSHIVNEAIDNGADLLVMPEAYVPYEWLPILAQTCKKRQVAIITGVEHIKLANKMWNFTAVMLPYVKNDHKDAYISFHLKNHYAPSEIDSILGYGLSYEEGNIYELYKWNGCYFPVYCCYELASIKDRALFQSLADFVVAVEWNRDVKYYSSVAESLSRDMHCYFIQVNSANYGDSRIVKPSRDVEKDLIRTKGGINSSVLVDIIDIRKLREFQIKRYNLQKNDKSFKPTPPNFDRTIVMKKIKNEIEMGAIGNLLGTVIAYT